MQVSIIIVSYNAEHHLQFCLESCVAATKTIEAEVIVVDNYSPDGIIEKLQPLFPSVQFYALKENLGFSKANNFGVEKAKGDYVLILNPDTIIPENLFDLLLPFIQQNDNIGIIGPRLMDLDGKFHPESKRNLPTPRNSFSKLFKFRNTSTNTYYKEDVKENEVAPVPILVGAFMFLKQSTYQLIGGFDSRYFMYGEDIDFSYSAELAGFTNYYKGDCTVIHFKGESTKKDKKYFKIFFDAMLLFVEKYYAQKPFQLIVMKAGITFKYLLELIKFQLKEKEIAENRVQKNELFWLNKSSELLDQKNKHVVLSTDKFTFQEILEIIAQNNSSHISFYIHSHLSGKIIGSQGLIL